MCPSSTVNVVYTLKSLDYHTTREKVPESQSTSLPFVRKIMALKRKRSDSEISPTSSSTATFPSRDPSSSPCTDISMLDDAPFAEQPIYRPEIVPSHLNSRTRKRFRDNRPNESKIHGTHLLLYTFDPSTPFASFSVDMTLCQKQRIKGFSRPHDLLPASNILRLPRMFTYPDRHHSGNLLSTVFGPFLHQPLLSLSRCFPSHLLYLCAKIARFLYRVRTLTHAWVEWRTGKWTETTMRVARAAEKCVGLALLWKWAMVESACNVGHRQGRSG